MALLAAEGLTQPPLPPRAQEAVRYHNRTAAQKKMLDFARQYLQADDEVNDIPGADAAGCFWGCWVVRVSAVGTPGQGPSLGGDPTPKPVLEKRLRTGPLSPAASSCPSRAADGGGQRRGDRGTEPAL